MFKLVVAAIVGMVAGVALSGPGSEMGAAALSGSGLYIAAVGAIVVGLILVLRAKFDAAKMLGVALIAAGFGLLIGPVAVPA